MTVKELLERIEFLQWRYVDTLMDKEISFITETGEKFSAVSVEIATISPQSARHDLDPGMTGPASLWELGT